MKHFFLITLLVALSAARVIEDVRGVPEQGLQGYFDTLREIIAKLKELGQIMHDQLSNLIDTSRSLLVNAVSSLSDVNTTRAYP